MTFACARRGSSAFRGRDTTWTRKDGSIYHHHRLDSLNLLSFLNRNFDVHATTCSQGSCACSTKKCGEPLYDTSSGLQHTAESERGRAEHLQQARGAVHTNIATSAGRVGCVHSPYFRALFSSICCTGGCGSFYAISISSRAFEGLSMIKQHRLVNDALKQEIQGIHGLQVSCRIVPQNLILTRSAIA